MASLLQLSTKSQPAIMNQAFPIAPVKMEELFWPRHPSAIHRVFTINDRTYEVLVFPNGPLIRPYVRSIFLLANFLGFCKRFISRFDGVTWRQFLFQVVIIYILQSLSIRYIATCAAPSLSVFIWYQYHASFHIEDTLANLVALSSCFIFGFLSSSFASVTVILLIHWFMGSSQFEDLIRVIIRYQRSGETVVFDTHKYIFRDKREEQDLEESDGAGDEDENDGDFEGYDAEGEFKGDYGEENEVETQWEEIDHDAIGASIGLFGQQSLQRL
ncbi:hypothetical protein TWF694_008754 [Orbilia ellipsospora]|uniref:PRA1 family protein n=1 Tax=Orbilia ellipsospora TaxID=2528407 RepID=A0AAV9XCV2_9PEZI